MNLRTRLLRAGAWTAGAYSIESATRLISNLILTRLLFPEAFGLVAASTSLLVGLNLISDFGIRAVVIQSSKWRRVRAISCIQRGGISDLARNNPLASSGIMLWIFAYSTNPWLSSDTECFFEQRFSSADRRSGARAVT